MSRRVDKSVEVSFALLLFLASLREWLGHIREATAVAGAPFFGSCSLHTAYRSAPYWVLSSRVYALVLHEVITARKRLATFTYESCKKTK